MVRRGVILSLRDASCCSDDVMNGAEGGRCLSARLSSEITKREPFTAETTF
jgi:hypothetical protein